MLKKLKSFLIFAFLLLLSLTYNYALAASPYAKFHLSRGVGKMCYYVDSSASIYALQINTAVDNWVNTGYGWNPIYMTPVASNYATDMDFYVVDDYAIGGATKSNVAKTYYFTSDSVDLYGQNNGN